MEPYLEVESGAGVAGGVEKAESDTAVDAATNENGDSERRVMRHGTAEEVAVDVDGGEMR